MSKSDQLRALREAKTAKKALPAPLKPRNGQARKPRKPAATHEAAIDVKALLAQDPELRTRAIPFYLKHRLQSKKGMARLRAKKKEVLMTPDLTPAEPSGSSREIACNFLNELWPYFAERDGAVGVQVAVTEELTRILDDAKRGARAESSAAFEAMRKALEELSEMYTHAWDLTNGGLTMLGGSMDRFERAHENARAALAAAEGKAEDENVK